MRYLNNKSLEPVFFTTKPYKTGKIPFITGLTPPAERAAVQLHGAGDEDEPGT
jgi:hypothetical protein